MSIKRIFIAISAIFAASAVFADNSSVTSKKYVDDLMSGYQGKLPGSGANTLMIYDDEAGIGAKSIAATLGNSASATSVPTVGAVKTGLDGKQDTITGTAGYVMTGTGTPGEVGEKPIYSSTIRDEDSLVTAESVNSGVINAVNHSLRRVNANGELDNNGTLWEIADTVVALSYLPAGYTQLEYIESSSDHAQYIDTGLPASSNTRVLAKLRLLSVSFNFSISLRDSASVGAGFGFGVNGSSQFISDFGGDRQIFTNISPNTTDIFTVDKNKNVCTVSVGGVSETVTNTASAFTLMNTLPFFAQNSAGSVTKGFFAFYSFKMWDGDTLVRDMIPARNSSGVVGMYDIVSDNFFTNAGTGNFIAGPAVGN